MDPVLAIGIIGGGLIAFKAFKKDEPAEMPGDGYNTVVTPDVSANADQMGYERISQAEYDENGVQAGEVVTLKNEKGELVGTVVGTEGGNQVFQRGDGSVSIREAGEPEIDSPVAQAVKAMPPVGKAYEPLAATKTAVSTAKSTSPLAQIVQKRAATQGSKMYPAASKAPAPTNVPKLTIIKPKQPISNSLLDKRIRLAAKSGLRIPM